jgi:DNA helicase-2/ATP-dependent DNA helicase PcrA
MKFVADLHIHSKFSRATSRDMVLDALAPWARVKGVSLLATGDFTHPEWLFLMKEKLEPMGNGFLRLRNGTAAYEAPPFKGLPLPPREVAFILSSELSFIYSKGGKVRKVHVMLLAPDFESVERVNSRLQAVGNLVSDGRPILGLDVRLFARMVADAAPRCVVIPSHVWTPWFSLFGANSGFDSIEECFEEMTPSIFALETGLSSDPPMNRRLSALDRYALVSNSDAHSPSKIGREANAFDADFSYRGLIDALRTNDPAKFLYTVEFFPEEGKYHYDGPRKRRRQRAAREPEDERPLPQVRQEADHRRPPPRRGAGRPSDRRRPAGAGPVQEPHPAQRDHRRGPGQDARVPGRLGPVFPLHPGVRGRARHPDRGPRA